jgi:acylphosphatase
VTLTHPRRPRPPTGPSGAGEAGTCARLRRAYADRLLDTSPVYALRVIRRRVIVEGLVQGVGFRVAVTRAARSRGVTGCIWNRYDGSVEAIFEGEEEAVDSLVRLCREGPRGAVVDRVQVIDEESEGFTRFVVR